MLRLDADKPVSFCDGFNRRDFFHVGALSGLGLSLVDVFGLKALGSVDAEKDPMNCIFLFLVGGPSQLDTWDMKPDAPAEIRGPFKPIATNVDGIRISEIFPRMARHADKYSLVRSLYHTAAAVHDTGHQMMQTGPPFSSRHGAPARRLRHQQAPGPAWGPAGPRPDPPSHRQDRRQHAPRPGRRVPGPGARPLRPQQRPVPARFQGAGPSASRLHLRKSSEPAP